MTVFAGKSTFWVLQGEATTQAQLLSEQNDQQHMHEWQSTGTDGL